MLTYGKYERLFMLGKVNNMENEMKQSKSISQVQEYESNIKALFWKASTFQQTLGKKGNDEKILSMA